MAMLTTKFNSGVSSSIGSPGGTVSSMEMNKIRRQTNIKIGTWNVRTLNQDGKTHNAIQEMTRMKIDILGISEMRWLGSGSCVMDDHTVLYSGTSSGIHEYGVGMILTKEMAKYISNVVPVSERVMLVQLRATPVDINIIQVYAPTTDRSDEELEEFYNSVNEVMKKLKKHEVTITMGDFNAKIGAGRTSEFVGPFGLGDRNDRGDNLEIFAETHQSAIMNTWFKQPSRRLYTWKSPQDKPDKIVRNQIDYILVNKRYRNSCTTVRTYPGADIASDHVPLVGNFKIKMKKVLNKKTTGFDLRKLKDPLIKAKVKEELNDKIKEWDDTNIYEIEHIKRIVEEVKQKHLKQIRGKRRHG
uniref:Craniofacial development protein 2 n=1 Tax=Cacopsylla melanoneura TaxID=428564 RepID=A0A8D9ASD9_9HEMI